MDCALKLMALEVWAGDPGDFRGPFLRVGPRMSPGPPGTAGDKVPESPRESPGPLRSKTGQ
jgi:hypothetical protein